MSRVRKKNGGTGDFCGPMLCIFHCSASTAFKITYAPLWVMNYSPPLFQKRNVANFAIIYRYLYGICLDLSHSAVPPALSFIFRTRHNIFTGIHHPDFLHVSLIRSKFISVSWAVTVWSKLPKAFFPGNYSIPGSTDIYPHNLQFLITLSTSVTLYI